MKTRLMVLIGFGILLISLGFVLFLVRSSHNATIQIKQEFTTIYFPSQKINLGTIRVGRSIEIKIPFENKGENKLIIYSIIPDCGCMVPSWPLRPIPPCSKDNLNITFTPGATGYFNKSFSVFSNSRGGPEIICITGIVNQ